jgi:hypothetical protein
MGTLRSKTNRVGVVVNGVTLGDAPITLIDGTPPQPGDSITELWFRWDDPRLPTGIVYASGAVDLDEPADI